MNQSRANEWFRAAADLLPSCHIWTGIAKWLAVMGDRVQRYGNSFGLISAEKVALPFRYLISRLLLPRAGLAEKICEKKSRN